MLKDQATIPFSLQGADLELWLQEPMPCILILYEAQTERAYWLYLQAYFEAWEGFNIAGMGKTITVHFSKSNIVNEEAIKTFARYRDNVLRQIQGVIRHHA
jgi:hypothetical protein